MNLLQRRALISVVLTMGLLLLLAIVAGRYVVNSHLSALDVLDQIEPRHARFLGLRDTGVKIDEALKESRAVLLRLGYPADRDAAQVGNELQQMMRRAMQTAGVAVSSSQVLDPRSEAGFDRILVSLQAEGPLSGVQLALAALQAETPRVIFESVLLQATGRTGDDGSPVVNCRMTVAALRLQS
jgi:general secretion pathway protein M